MGILYPKKNPIFEIIVIHSRILQQYYKNITTTKIILKEWWLGILLQFQYVIQKTLLMWSSLANYWPFSDSLLWSFYYFSFNFFKMGEVRLWYNYAFVTQLFAAEKVSVCMYGLWSKDQTITYQNMTVWEVFPLQLGHYL